jgi:hypothetical protein
MGLLSSIGNAFRSIPSSSSSSTRSIRSDGVVTLGSVGSTEIRSDGLATRLSDTFTLGPSGLETNIGNFTIKPDGSTAFHF